MPDNSIRVSKLSLPPGGGAIQGLGETFQANEFSGTASLSIPIATSPCRDFAPQLAVDYSSGGGQGPWGMGMSLSIPQITRQIHLGTPKYEDSDIFVLAGAADLVPVANGARQATLGTTVYTVQTYQPRQEGAFALIEYWQPQGGNPGEAFWQVTAPDHTISIYGKTAQARIADPDEPDRVFAWLLEESYNAKGDHQLFFYKQENTDNLPPEVSYEEGHVQTAQRYIERIRYGNQTAKEGSMLLTDDPAIADPAQWHFELVFDYGEYDLASSNPYTPPAGQACAARPDPFSSYNAGFEIRTHRRCLHTLMFHRFSELGPEPVLVQAMAYAYQLNHAQMSELKEVTTTGYTYDPAAQTYSSATLPPLTLAYTAFAPTGHDFVTLTDAQETALPGLNEPPHYTLVDMFGEGIPGVFYNDGTATYYREPVPSPDEAPNTALQPLTGNSEAPALHYGDWQVLDEFPLQRQTNAPGVALQDITGNGQLDLVMEGPGWQGYWEVQPDRHWKPFHDFSAWPTEFPAPGQAWVDMTGDGVADLVQLTAQGVRIYPSAREQGLKPPIDIAVEGVPDSLSVFPDQAVRWADMAGSGQAHLVRIRNGEVVYWPNLSHGRFGAPITMDNVPDWGTDFDTTQLSLADLDGSGTSDLIYFTGQEARLYFNQSGNRLSDPITISLPTPFTQLQQVTFADVYGQGNECLVISEPRAEEAPLHWCYDFCQGKKPYLLRQVANNLGATTEITYGSSVDFYLADKAAGSPWITNLPFPVQVVTQLTHRDEISATHYTSLYSYHHGFYDGVEREFRGFGRVDRQDTEYFPADGQDPNKDPHYVAPAHSRTWYHTGASTQPATLSRQYADEYYAGDAAAFRLPDSTLPTTNLSEEETRQAYVAMAGTVLRTELYGLDDSPTAGVPYTVSENNFRVLLQQAQGTNPYAIFFVHPEQSLTHTYERNAADPQIHHEFTLQVDAYGNVQRTCSLAYPRRQLPTATDSMEQAALQEGQGTLKAMAAWQAYVNDPTPATYLLGVATESQNYDASALALFTNYAGEALDFDAVRQALEANVWGPTTGTTLGSPSPTTAPLLSWERLYYADPAGIKLPLGQVALPVLLAEHHVAEGTETQIEAAFAGTPMAGTALTTKLEQGYYRSENGYWWNPGLTEQYLGLSGFYRSQVTLDPDGNSTTYAYDPHHLLLTEARDALNNTIQTDAIDYQSLQPMKLVDANGNTSEIKLDPLNRVVYTSYYGQEAGQPTGFAPLDGAPTAQPADLEALLADPAAFLGGAQSYFYYDPFAWQDRQAPVFGVTLVAEQYPDDNQPVDATTIQIALSYNDGLGRPLCSKTKVEPGESFIYNPITDEITSPAGTIQDRWLTSGRVVYNNKGKAVKQYEPYYIDTPVYVSNPVLDTFGVTPTLYYDPLERVTQVLTAKGFYSQHTWTAWEEKVDDENDMLAQSPYYQANIASPDPQSPYYDEALTAAGSDNLVYVAQHFADTPTTHTLDNLGRVIIEAQINQSKDTPAGETLRTYHFYDILGRALRNADPQLSQGGHYNFETTYSLSGQVLKTVSADAGTSWGLANTMGNPIWRYDERQVTVTPTYDELHRPTAVHVHKPTSAQDPLALDQIVEQMVYGDTPGAVTDPSASNLQGQLYKHYDSAGLVTVPGYSLLGKPLEIQRRFREDYKTEAVWDDLSTAGTLLQSGTPYTEQVAYDALGRVTQDTDAANNVVAPTYHPHSGRLFQITLTPDDDTAHPISVVTDITYNARNQRKAIQYGNNTTTTYGYDPKTFETRHIQTKDSSNKLLQDLHYVYDPVGNVVAKTDEAEDTVFHNNQQVDPLATYTYDSLYRLIEATGRAKQGDSAIINTQQLENYVEKYSYNQGSNLTQTQYIAAQQSWTKAMVVSDTSNRAVLSTLQGENVTLTPQDVAQYFDAHGNQVQTEQVHPLAWNYRNNLQQATVVRRENGPDDADYYVYDGGGRRVRKVHEQYGHGATSVTIKEALYLGHLEIRRTLQGADPGNATVDTEYHSVRLRDDRQSVLTRDYWAVGTPPSGFQSPVLRYHLEDHLNSCTVEVDATGQQLSREEYSPFGRSTLFIGTGSASDLKHYRYSGQEKDSVTGFYYYGARYYAPGLGRWLSPDPAGTVDGLNLYAFVSNNPVTYWDVGGMGSGKPNSAFRSDEITQTYRGWNPKEMTKQAIILNTTYGPVSAIHKRGAPKIGSQKKDYPGAKVGDKYSDYIEKIRKPSARDTNDKEIAIDLLNSTQESITTNEQKRAAAMLVATVGLAEQFRKHGAVTTAELLLKDVADGKSTLDDFFENFKYVESAEKGRKFIGEVQDFRKNFSKQAPLGFKNIQALHNLHDSDLDTDNDMDDPKRLKSTRHFGLYYKNLKQTSSQTGTGSQKSLKRSNSRIAQSKRKRSRVGPK